MSHFSHYQFAIAFQETVDNSISYVHFIRLHSEDVITHFKKVLIGKSINHLAIFFHIYYIHRLSNSHFFVLYFVEKLFGNCPII